MSIMDFFKPTVQPVAQPVAQPQTTPPGNIPQPDGAITNTGDGTAPNGAIPGGQGSSPDSPLANYADLWKNKPNESTSAEPTLELKAEDVQGIVNKANFSSVLTPEMLAAIGEGGEGAQQAFSLAMNEVAKNVMVQATLVNNKLTQKAVKDALEHQKKSLPELLRQQSVLNHSKESNPLFTNPAVQPILESAQEALMRKFPDAPPADITRMAQEYIVAMGEAFAPKPTVTVPAGEQDWSKFLS